MESTERHEPSAERTPEPSAQRAPEPSPSEAQTPSDSGDEETKDTRRHLATYLDDHLAGAAAGVELARRAARNNEGTPLGRFLEDLTAVLEEDASVLKSAMLTLDCRPSPMKVAGGWVAEKVGRLKSNGHLFSYSPLSRVEELEGLMTGSRGRVSLFETLADLFDDQPLGQEMAFGARAHRAREYLRELSDHAREAKRVAFAPE
jgi:hypothetical protein